MMSSSSLSILLCMACAETSTGVLAVCICSIATKLGVLAIYTSSHCSTDIKLVACVQLGHTQGGTFHRRCTQLCTIQCITTQLTELKAIQLASCGDIDIEKEGVGHDAL